MRNTPTTSLVLSVATVLCAAASAPGTASAQKDPRAPTVDEDGVIEYGPATFEMGVATDLEVGDYGNSWNRDQQPKHTVELDAFFLDRREVTVRDFALFLTYAAGELHYNERMPIDRVEAGYRPAEGTAEQPIRQVTWKAASAYCSWAGGRLPTEAEWEFAAAGKQGREYPWGGEKGPSCQRTVYYTSRAFCEDGPVAVDARPNSATPDGAELLAGNVAEWVADYYGPYPTEDKTFVNPTGPDEGAFRVVRGGGYLDGGRFLRSRARRAVKPGLISENIGFRCARDADRQPDDIERGELSLPANEGREDHDRFPAPAVETPEPTVEGLGAAGPVAAFRDNFYVIDTDGGRLLEATPDGQVTSLVEMREGLSDLAAGRDRLWVTDSKKGEVLSVIPGMGQTTVATDQTKAGPVDTADGYVVWGTDSAIVRHDPMDDTTETLVDQLDEVRGVAATADSVYFITKSKVGRVKLKDGTVLSRKATEDFRFNFKPAGLAVDAASETIYYTVSRGGFPRHGYLCRFEVADDNLSCPLTHSPPRPGDIVYQNQTAYWVTQRSLTDLDFGGGETFGFPAKWTRVGGMTVADGHLIWTDLHTGRLFRLPLP